MARAKKPQARVAIFAEGSEYTDPKTRRIPFIDLWIGLCSRLAVQVATIRVFPFNKLQIELLGDDVGAQSHVFGAGREPLDVLIRRMYERNGFDVAVIAFDRTPPNKVLEERNVRLCLRTEVNFVLERIIARKMLDGLPFHDEASRLLEYYRNNPRRERGPGRPPRGCLDLLYMDPEFEGLLACDEATVFRALEVEQRRKGWPKFDPHAHYPARDILGPAVKLASPKARAAAGGGDMKTNKHGWARWIINQAPDDARLFQHPIAQRLRTLLA